MFLFGYFPKEWGLTQFNNKKMLPEAIQLLEYQMVVGVCAGPALLVLT